MPKLPQARFILSPPAGLKLEIAITNTRPIIAKIIFLYLPLNSAFSSIIISGIANTTKPKNVNMFFKNTS